MNIPDCEPSKGIYGLCPLLHILKDSLLHLLPSTSEYSLKPLFSCEVQFYPLGLKIFLRLLLFFYFRTDIPDLIWIQEVPIIGAFLHKGMEELGITPEG